MAPLTALAQLLQQGRQARGWSLAELAQRLHMGQEQLKALEQADTSRLPEPVFVIAQSRRVAAALDLDAGAQIDALRDCAAFQSLGVSLNPDRFKTKDRPASPAPSKPVALSGPRPGRIKTASGSPAAVWIWPAGLLIAAAGWGLWAHRSQLGWPQMLRPFPAQPMALQPAPIKPEPIKPATIKAKTKAPAPAAAAVELVVRAQNTSWLEVTSGNGRQKLFRGMFKGQRRFPLAQGLNVLAGRPDLVAVGIGAATPKPLGTIKDIRWFRFKPAAQPTVAQPPARAQALKPR